MHGATIKKSPMIYFVLVLQKLSLFYGSVQWHRQSWPNPFSLSCMILTTLMLPLRRCSTVDTMVLIYRHGFVFGATAPIGPGPPHSRGF